MYYHMYKIYYNMYVSCLLSVHIYRCIRKCMHIHPCTNILSQVHMYVNNVICICMSIFIFLLLYTYALWEGREGRTVGRGGEDCGKGGEGELGGGSGYAFQVNRINKGTRGVGRPAQTTGILGTQQWEPISQIGAGTSKLQVLPSQMGTSLSNSHRLRVHQGTTQLRIDPTSEPFVLSGGSGTLSHALGRRTTNFLVTWHRVYCTCKCVASWRSSAADSFHPRGGPGGGGGTADYCETRLAASRTFLLHVALLASRAPLGQRSQPKGACDALELNHLTISCLAFPNGSLKRWHVSR